VEPGYVIWREDKNQKQVMAHIKYIKTEDAWFGLHYVKNIPYATMGSKIAKGKYGLRRKGGKTPNLYLWRNDPEPMLEEENISEIPTILQTAEASLVPEDIETIIQGIAAIPTTNQPMDDEEPLQYFPPIIQTDPIAQVNLAMIGDDPDNDKEEQVKTSKGGLKGSPPTKFNGDRKTAKQFMNDFRAYRFLNRKNETMKVAANRVALALTFIKGEQVQDWANSIMDLMEERLDSRLNPMQETNEYHWTSFKDTFRDAFTDTSEWEDTDNQLQNLKMTNGDLDKFIAHFNCLVIISEREDETRGLVPLFKEGLPFSLAQACMN